MTTLKMLPILLLCSLCRAEVAGYLYLRETPIQDAYCSTVPVPAAVPIAGAEVIVGGVAHRTAWQGMFCTSGDLTAEPLTVAYAHPLTGQVLRRTVTAKPDAGGCTITGYVARSAYGTHLLLQDWPATPDRAIYAARVTLDDGTSAISMDDGHFTFNGLAPGSHTVTAWAIFGGRVRVTMAAVQAVAGQSVVVTGAEDSSEAAPPLSFLWTSSLTRFGSPTGFYMSTCVVDRDGRPPSNVSSDPASPDYFRLHLASLITRSPVGATAAKFNGNLGYELANIADVTATATLGDTSITESVSGRSIGTGARVAAPVNIAVEPNPIVVGQPALIRWTEVGSLPSAGTSVSMQTSLASNALTYQPAPACLGASASYRGFYPRRSVLLSAEDTSRLTAGTPCAVTITTADTLDAATMRQCWRTRQVFVPGSEEPRPPTLCQSDLPLSGEGTFDGYLYFAEPPTEAVPVVDLLVISPRLVPTAIPAGSTPVACNGQETTTSRDGHLHLSGLAPEPLVLTVGHVVNPTTGEEFSRALVAQCVPQVASTEPGSLVCYLYRGADGGLRVSPGPDPESTPFLAARVLVDSPDDETDPSSSNIRLPDADGSILLTDLAAGPHHMRAEGIAGGRRYVVEREVTVAGGAVTSWSADAGDAGPAGEVNVLGAQSHSSTTIRNENTLWLCAVDSDGRFLRYTSSDTMFRVGFGPKSTDCNHVFQSGAQDSAGAWWWYLWNPTHYAGMWHLGGGGRYGCFRIWRNAAGFDTADGLVLETPNYNMPAGDPVGMPPYIKTCPSPLVAGRPAVVWWGEGAGTAGYVLWVERNALAQETVRPGTPWAGLSRPTPSRVAVLSGAEVSTLVPNTRGPCVLSVHGVNSQYWSKETMRAWNYVTISPVEGP